MKNKTPYIHGYTEEEQKRLRRQAESMEFLVYQDINFSDATNILEVGSGVGAQSAILLRRFPKAKLDCVELNSKQIAAAKSYLASLPGTTGRYEIHELDATKMEMTPGKFDGAFICWLLEHVPDPARVLAEVRRVVAPGANVYINEVMNSSFFLDPYSPNTWKYWMAFNEYQYAQKGDPFVGAKLGNLLQTMGFHNIRTRIKVMHFDNRQPQKRREMIRQWTELLLSAAPVLVDSGHIDQATVEGMRHELTSVESDPNAVFFYAFVQAYATT